MLRSLCAAFIGVILLSVSGALAADLKPLTEDQAKRFVASLDSLESLRKELDEEGKIDNINLDAKPKPGEPFKPYSGIVESMKEKYPADHARLASKVKGHGFSAKDWGSVGDRIMTAYIAVKMLEEDPQAMAMMENMDQSMLDMMPPEMRAELEATFAMMEAAKNAPEADKKVVAAVKDEIEAYMAEGAPE